MPELIVGEYGKALVRCEKYHATHGIETCVARYKKWHGKKYGTDREDFRTCGQCVFISELLETRRDKCPYCGKNKWDWEPHCASNKCRSVHRACNAIEVLKGKENISTTEGKMSVMEAVEVAENKKSEVRGEKQKARCQICGALFTPYKNGIATIFRVCKSCMRKRIREGYEHQRDDQPLTLVFPDGYRDVYEWVMDKAREELRTPAMQIIWILKSVMEQQK